MTAESLKALAYAFLEEQEKIRFEPLHEKARISWDLSSLPNGIKRCTVQVECEAGCGWKVDSYGSEAELLSAKAEAIEKILQKDKLSRIRPSEILDALFPGLE